MDPANHKASNRRTIVSSVTYRADLQSWMFRCDGPVPDDVGRGALCSVVNLNPARWSTSGRVRVVAAEPGRAVRVLGSADARWDLSLLGWYLNVPSLGTGWSRVLAMEDHRADPDGVDVAWPYVLWLEPAGAPPASHQVAHAHRLAPGGVVRAAVEREPRGFVPTRDRLELVPGDAIAWL